MENCLNLAFVGDAVYSLMAREFVLKNFSGKIGALHKECNKFVCANSQATVLDAVFKMLTPNELDIANRARNVKVSNVPKSAGLENYKKSTSLEAVFGFNYVNNNMQRIKQLFEIAINVYNKGEIK